MSVPPEGNEGLFSQPCGEASANAEVFAGLDVERAAASIAFLVDEYTQRGWNDQGRAKFAATVARRLRRFAELPSSAGSEPSVHPDWHLCCEPTEAMLTAGYIDADGQRQDLTPDEMHSLWFRMHAEIRRDS